MKQDINHFIGNPEEFPILREWDFFNHAGVSPLPRCASDALRLYAQQAEKQTYLFSNWYDSIEKTRKTAAKLINAHRDEIAFIKNTSEGISTFARGVDWNEGDVIVTTAVEYPANVYPWMEIERTHGVKLVRVPEEIDEDGAARVKLEAILKAASDPKCRMITISSVQYASGQRHDLHALGQFCRDNNKLFCVDAIQSIGVLPIDVQSMHIDYLAADAHKWMMGPEGIGFMYVRRELIEKTRPLAVGWLSVINPLDYGDINYTFKPDATRYECGTLNVPGILAIGASLEMLDSIGIDQISKRVHHLSQYTVNALKSKGHQIVSPRGMDEWSGGVCFNIANADPHQLVVKLRKEHKTEIALREGRLRISAHVYNTEEQIDRLVGRLS
jgi:selenocysteine lyase/cysteine desulfurase